VQHVALPRLLAVAMAQPSAQPPPGGRAPLRLAALHGATLELVCRSLAALGHNVPPPDDSRATPDPDALDAAAHSEPQQQHLQRHPQQRQEAFEALLVHISAYCHMLTAPAAGSKGPAFADGTVGLQLADAATEARAPGMDSTALDLETEAAADAGDAGAQSGVPMASRLAVLLAQRAFGELAAAVTAAAARGLVCSRAQTLLLHLLKARVPASCCSCARASSVNPYVCMTTRVYEARTTCRRCAVSSRCVAPSAASPEAAAGRRRTPAAGALRRASPTQRCWTGCGST
jgi:hypothetical protein